MKETRETPTDVTQTTTTVRSTDEQLTDILKLWKLKGRRWPNGMPYVPQDAATWWMAHQNPHYASLLIPNLRKFLRLPNDKQRLILAAFEDGIVWRGDDVEHPLPQFGGLTMFENIIKETERMREIGIDLYRTTARSALKIAVNKTDAAA